MTKFHYLSNCPTFLDQFDGRVEIGYKYRGKFVWFKVSQEEYDKFLEDGGFYK